MDSLDRGSTVDSGHVAPWERPGFGYGGPENVLDATERNTSGKKVLPDIGSVATLYTTVDGELAVYRFDDTPVSHADSMMGQVVVEPVQDPAIVDSMHPTMPTDSTPNHLY